jgi:hypothetical protein
VYGPYADDVINRNDHGVLRAASRRSFGEHILDGRVCAGCHTLITETFDLNGNLTGDEFVEQATWHEWLNSVYDGSQTTCRDCHMPRISDAASSSQPSMPSCRDIHRTVCITSRAATSSCCG